MQCARCFFYDNDVGDEVCRRCGRAYLPEANVYLGLLLLLTGSVAWILRQLLTGSADPFIRPALDLGAWATWPPSIVDHPAYGLVMGGYLAMLAVAPIMTSILYGKRGGLLLAIIEALVGPSLLLAGAAALGVFVAASWPLRLHSKLVSVLLGLIPSAVWWFTATALSKVDRIAPALAGMIYVPPVAAVALAVLAAVGLVLIGKADRWHVRWPGTVLALVIIGPVVALLALVGVDEIRYQMMRKDLDSHPNRLQWQDDPCRQFIKRYPKSPRAAEVRAQLALALEDAVAQAAVTGSVLVPAEKPEMIWMELIAQNPDSPWAIDARLHMGDIAAGGGDFSLAHRYYGEALDHTTGVQPAHEDPLADFSVLGDYFTIGAELRAHEAADHRLTARQTSLMRLALLGENKPASDTANKAMALYFKSLGYPTADRRRMLLKAQEADPSGPLADNVVHDLAMLEPGDEDRLAKLEALAASRARTDGALLAHLSAAEILIARATSPRPPADSSGLARAQKHLQDVRLELARRFEHDPEDPYVAALADPVEKRLLYVGAQLRTPEPAKP